MNLLRAMSRLLLVEHDSMQADALREALRAEVPAELLVAQSLDDALAWIDLRLPDLILLPTLMPASVEDYLIAYLGTIPSAGHVQILGLPRFGRPDEPLPPRKWSLFRWPWRRRQQTIVTPSLDPGAFTQDVIDYLATASGLKKEIAVASAIAALSGNMDRRREPRFTNTEVPWISLARMGSERASLVNVSARGALVRMQARPEHHFLRRLGPSVRGQSRLTLEVASGHVHALGRVIRCVPLRTGARTQYEIAFLFDDKAARDEAIVQRLELTDLVAADTGIVVLK
jgi:hypothetical protein